MQAIELGKEALRTIWSNKYLWFFGVFVAGGSGGGGGSGGAVNGNGEAAPGWLWALLVGAAILGLVAFVLHVVSEAALIEGVRSGRGGEGRLGVRRGLRLGLAHFWRVLGIKLVLFAVALVTVALLAAPAAAGALGLWPLWLGVGLTVVLLLPAVPWLLTVMFIYEYALRFAVLEGQGVRAAVLRAYRFLHGRLVDSLKLLLLATAGRAAGSLLILMALAPVLALAAAAYFVGGLVPAVGVGAGLGLPVLLLVSGAMGAFASTVWTLGVLDAGEAKVST